MNGKNLVRVVVALGLLAWPGVELYRLQVAEQQAAAAQELAQSVTQKLAQMKSVEVAAKAKDGTKP